MSRRFIFASEAPYFIADRSRRSLPTPRFEDVGARVADLLPLFTEAAVRRAYRGGTVPVTIGARTRARFPRSSRFRRAAVVAWSRRNTAFMVPGEAFTALFDPTFRPLEPYAAVPVRDLGEPLAGVLREMERRLCLDPQGFSLIWIGQGGFVTPLHHDGQMVHGRWHLVVAGGKQWDFVPPRLAAVPRMPPWDLHRRFSALYKEPVPDTWQAKGARRLQIGPGQMVSWARNWWHRVEIAREGVTIGLSTRGHRAAEGRQLRGLLHRLESHLVGEIEYALEGSEETVTLTALADLLPELPAGRARLGA
jgi:hypothetical protein